MKTFHALLAGSVAVAATFGAAALGYRAGANGSGPAQARPVPRRAPIAAPPAPARPGAETAALRAEVERLRAEVALRNARLRLMEQVTSRIEVAPTETAQALPPEEIRRRIGIIRKSFDAALEKESQEELLAALTEIQALGEPAFADAAALWTRLQDRLKDPAQIRRRMTEGGGPSLRDQAFSSALGADLLEWMMAHAGTGGRHRGGIPYEFYKRAPDRVGKAITADVLLRQESDSTRIAMIEALLMSPDSQAERKILEMARRHADADGRRVAALYLGSFRSQDARDLLQELAGSDPDPAVREAAQRTLSSHPLR